MLGCFHHPLSSLHLPRVFPAYAGVFLYSTCKNCHKLSIPRIRGGVSPRPPEPVERQGIPRIRGGVSRCIRRKTAQTQYSPHTRGCFRFNPLAEEMQAVFPAYAGVFPFSVEKVCVDQVFPACAGVCLFQCLFLVKGIRFPGMCGGVSKVSTVLAKPAMFPSMR